MEISENDLTSSPHEASSGRRKSGRAVKAPEKFVPDVSSSQLVNGSSKRKRGAGGEGNEENDASHEGESDEDEEEESADEEELKERAKKTRRPVAKKAKTNGQPKVNGAVAHNPAMPIRLPARPKKKGKKVTVAKEQAEGLYAEIFISTEELDEVAAVWVSRFEANDAEALCSLVNALLKSAGCDEKITEHDIQDTDNIPNKLNDLSEGYQNLNIVDYPLISKSKDFATFRTSMQDFYAALVDTIHKSGILYTEEPLMENLTSWVTAMAESKVRPFRHTATLVAMSIVDGLCKASKSQYESTAKTLRLLEGEKKKKKGSNKARMAELEQMVEEGKNRSDDLAVSIKHYWEGVFIHRYRDIDPKIRAECAEGLGSWAHTLPETFLEGSYLRYMGWMLSDSTSSVRQEVVEQLEKLFGVKENHPALRHFIERFRERMIQMATRDCECDVRVSTVALLDVVREGGMLLPDDIDIIGKLIFDPEARVRKAIVDFFADNVNESNEAKVDELIEDIGSREDLLRLLKGPEDTDRPARLDWIKLKCLAELLSAYDSEESEDIPSQIQRGPGNNSDFINATGVESRFSLATQVLFGNNKIPEVKKWRQLAEYLLFDKTITSSNNDEPRNKIMLALQLEEKEETILLEVMNASVKLTLAEFEDSGKHGRKKKPSKGDATETKESVAFSLAALIPRLLSKFGSSPNAAAIVLRLEHLLNLSVFQELRQDSTTYAGLLDNISSQFTGHEDQKVLNEAIAAFLHARSFEDLEDVTEEKLQLLWQDVIDTLLVLVRNEAHLTIRGDISRESLTAISNTIRRISKLASISDCVEIFESSPSGSSLKEPITILLELVARGNLEEPDAEVDDIEDELVSSAMRSVMFYFMWKIRAMRQMAPDHEIPPGEAELFKERQVDFSNYLLQCLSSRVDIDAFRLLSTGIYLDFYTLFSTLRDDYPELVGMIGPEAQAEITSIFVGMEKQYAKKAKKNLEPPQGDEEPEDVEEEAEEDPTEVNDSERQNEILMAEKRLCELTGKLILAISAKVIDASGSLKGKLCARLQRNRNKLGVNFKTAISFLDKPKPKEKRSHKSKAQQAATAAKKNAKSEEKVAEDAEDEIEDDDPFAEAPEEGTREDLRRRELLEEDNEDEDGIESVEGNQNGVGEAAADHDEDEDEMMGD